MLMSATTGPVHLTRSVLSMEALEHRRQLVQFHRLLSASERQLRDYRATASGPARNGQGGARAAGEEADPPLHRSPVYHHYVDTLRKMLGELVAGLSDEENHAYKQRVDKLSAALEPEDKPAYCEAGGLNNSIASPATGSSARLASATGLSRGRARSGLGAHAGEGGLSVGASAAIDTHRRLQEGLSDELVDLAAGLKRTAVAVDRTIAAGGAALGRAERLLERNVAAVGGVNAAAEVALAAGRRVSWALWGISLLVALLFALTYLLIKTTAGRAARAGGAVLEREL